VSNSARHFLPVPEMEKNMATNACPKCKSTSLVPQGFWNGETPLSDRGKMAYQSTNPAHGWMLAIRALGWAAELIFASVYKCIKCGHVFRVWVTD
jgi:DNA-directed RNA polymerase subunit RPC12/RpoP